MSNDYDHSETPDPNERIYSSPTPPRKKLRRPRKPEAPRRPQETIDSAWRLFIAVPLPPDVIQFVDRTIESLKQESWPVKWTEPNNAHITLQFLGEIDPSRADLVRLALRAPIEEHEAFTLRTSDLGAFPNIRRPRVLWLGLYGPAHRLQAIYEAIGVMLDELEFEVEDREFHPHITLGRVRSESGPRGRELPLEIRKRFDLAVEKGEVTNKQPVPLPIEELQLIRSHLGPNGARYEVLETYPLLPAEPKK